MFMLQANASVISLVFIDQHGQTTRLEGVRSNQPLQEVAIRLDARFQAAQQAGTPATGTTQQPEVDLMTASSGMTLTLSSLPSDYDIVDGSSIYCYRYGEACRDHRRKLTTAAVAAATAAAAARQTAQISEGGAGAGTGTDATDLVVKTPPSAIPRLPAAPQYVSLYLSDWLCGYQRRMRFHHDLALPFEVLLRPYCAMRGMRLEEVSWVWLQFYRKVCTGMDYDSNTGDTGMDLWRLRLGRSQ